MAPSFYVLLIEVNDMNIFDLFTLDPMAWTGFSWFDKVAECKCQIDDLVGRFVDHKTDEKSGNIIDIDPKDIETTYID